MLDNFRRSSARALGVGLVAMTLGCDPNVPPEPPDIEPTVRVPEPVATVEGDASRNLLQAYIDRDPDVVGVRTVPAEGDPTQTVKVPVTWEDESHTWRLPFQSKRLTAALLIAAAHDRLDNLRFVLTPDAQWGWPDRRRPGTRPVFAGDEGEAFFQAFRRAAARLPDQASWRSFPVPPGIQMLHATGAEPMWTVYAEGQATMIVMHLVLYRGEARIDYVGFFEELPQEYPNMEAYGPMPPLVPPRRPPPGAVGSAEAGAGAGAGAVPSTAADPAAGDSNRRASDARARSQAATRRP